MLSDCVSVSPSLYNERGRNGPDRIRTGQVSSAPHCSLSRRTGSQAKMQGRLLGSVVIVLLLKAANETWPSITIQTTLCEGF